MQILGIARTMTDRPSRIKNFSRSATGSLARRVLYASLALVGLPLLVHTFFLYRREYNLNVRDAFESLSYLSENRSLYLNQLILNQQNLLEGLSDDLPLAAAERDTLLIQEAKEYEVEQFLYIQIENGEPLCQDPICQDPSFRPFLQEALQKDKFGFINPFSEEKNYELIVGRTLPSPKDPQALFCVITSATQILERLSEIRDTVYPLRLSLIDEQGLIFLSTEEGLAGTKLAESTEAMEWDPYEELPNAWFLETPSESKLAVKRAIEGTDLVLLVDVPEKSIADLQLKDYLFRIGTFLFFVCLLGGGIVFWFTQRVAQPLKVLGDTMARVAEGALHVRFKTDPMGFEINAIGQQLNQMLDSLLTHQQAAERERIARERLAQELKIGQEIQASMLPTHLPQFPSLDIAPGYLAAREVSGDFYDLYIREDGKLFIAIADAADKGISACLYSLSFRSMLRTAAATKEDLSAIIQTANALLLHDTAESHFFITAWIGLYDPKTRCLQYSSHGHPPAYLRTQRGLELLTTGGMALGVQAVTSEVKEKRLQSQELLLLYTDGVIEAQDGDRQLFGKRRLEEFLRSCQSPSAQGVVELLQEELHLFCGGASQADDLTLLALIQK